jgi:hypothetical protein
VTSVITLWSDILLVWRLAATSIFGHSPEAGFRAHGPVAVRADALFVEVKVDHFIENGRLRPPWGGLSCLVLRLESSAPLLRLRETFAGLFLANCLSHL